MKTRLFADDSNAFVLETSSEKLKLAIAKVLKELFDWFNRSKLTANLCNTCYTIFKMKKKNYQNSFRMCKNK